MKHFRNILTTIFIFYSVLVFSQKLITVQSGSSAKFASSLDSALIIAQNGDFLYLPGGIIPFGGTYININKRLTIIGCGYNYDSSSATGITIINQKINFNSSSEGSLISGIYCASDIEIYTSKISIIRCLIKNRIIFNNSGAHSDFLLSENAITEINGNSSLSNTIIQKNIIYGSIYGCSNILFNNNLFLLSTNSTLILTAQNCLFKNNIFLHPATNFSSGPPIYNYFTNNLFVGDSTSAVYFATNTSIHNTFNEPLSNIFINANSSSWNSFQDYHLKPTCSGIGLGTDGREVGIYGTDSPFKTSALPLNPHFQQINIPESTGADGKLNINIKIRAQNQ